MAETELANIFSKPFVSVSDDTPLASAARMMVKHGIRHLPVMKDKTVIGILSDRDVQRALRVEVYKWGDISIQDKDFNPEHTVRDFMTCSVVSVDANAPLSQVAQQLLERRISSLLVTQDKQPVGIVTTDDLLRVLVGHLQHKEHGLQSCASRCTSHVMSTPIGSLIEELCSSGI